jgi:hypothetical protein
MRGEISKFIYESNYPEEVGATRQSWRDGKKVTVPAHRGYWGTNLTGNHTVSGILESFCIKTPERRYVVVEPIKPPFFRRRRNPQTKTFTLNQAKREYNYLMRKALAPKCKNCGEASIYKQDDRITPDGMAHFNVWATGSWKADCAGRVWLGNYKNTGLLTKLTKDQVMGLTECMRGKGVHSSLIEETVHRFVLDNVVPL